MSASALVAGKFQLDMANHLPTPEDLEPVSSKSRANSIELPHELRSYEIIDSERKAINEIRARLKVSPESRYNDIRICRFLRREKDIDKTEAMIRREMKWRDEVNIDKIVEEFPKSKYFNSLVNYWPGNFHGEDKFGVPILFERLGAIDLHSLLGQIPAEVLLEFHIWTIEKNDRIISEHFARLGAPVGYVYVMDLTGLSLKHYTSSCIDLLKKIQYVDDNYYPEFLRKVLVVNTPAVFAMFWSIAKVVMHKQSAAKFKVMKKDYVGELFSITNSDQIPSWLDGKCTSCARHTTEHGCAFGGSKFHML